MLIKFDGVIEAVRYGSDGKILMVRIFERRGPTFSDHILLDRAALEERLKKGQKFVTGQRKTFLGGTFQTGANVILAGDVIATTPGAKHDLLETVPVF